MNFYNENDPKAAAWLCALIKKGLIPAGRVREVSIEDLYPGEFEGYNQHHFFAGIGGWSYALQLAGWPEDRPVWTGSCPCQPFSIAGKGKGTADERHLWPVWRGLIAEHRPPVIFGEQVASPLGREWLSGVRADLEALGYEVGAADLCAASAGAPHIRQRLFWVADANLERCGEARGTCSRSGISGGDPSGGMANMPSTQFKGDQGRVLRVDEGRKALRQEDRQAGPIHDRPDMQGSGGLGDMQQQRSQGLRRDGDGSNQPGRIKANEDGPASPASFWSDFGIVHCRDDKARRIEPGTFPLATRLPGHVAKLRGLGNAIVPQAAATFIRAYMEAQ